MGQGFPDNASVPSGEQLRWALAEVDRMLWDMRTRDLGAPRAVAEAELTEAQRREWGQTLLGRAAQDHGLRALGPNVNRQQLACFRGGLDGRWAETGAGGSHDGV